MFDLLHRGPEIVAIDAEYDGNLFLDEAFLIHFFPIFSNDASRSPLALELTALGVPYKMFSSEVKLRYKTRMGLVFRGWPKLAWFALKSSFRSFVLSETRPTAVILGSDIEVIIFALMRALTNSRNTEIVYLGFILTARRNHLVNRMRELYFKAIFLFVDKIISHSKFELDRFTELFNNGRTKVTFIPYGLHIGGRDQPIAADAATRPAYILAAGRSGRDYATLFAAVTGLSIELHVVCDNQQALAGLAIPANVTVLTSCYDGAYVDQLKHAEIVVIPLGVDDISAGQMVLIQAMAFAKPTIITRTVTVEDYVADEEQSLLVPTGDVVALREAVVRLLADEALSAKLSANALASFENRFCMRAFVRNLVAVVYERPA